MASSTNGNNWLGEYTSDIPDSTPEESGTHLERNMSEPTILKCFTCDNRLRTKQPVPVGEIYWCGRGGCEPEMLPDAGENSTWREVGSFSSFRAFDRVPITASESNQLALVTGWEARRKARFHSSGQCGEGCQSCAARRAEESRETEALTKAKKKRAKEAEKRAKEAAELKSMIKRGLLINMKALLERGWTRTGIKKFLGEPYVIEERKWPQRYCVNWYLKAVVVKVKATPAFRKFQRKKAARSRAAQKGVDTKYEKTMAFIDDLDIQVPQWDRENLVRRACESYNGLASGRDADFASASIDSDPAFLDRITVNYIRHCLTNYEAALYARFGKVGVDDAADMIRSMINSAIARTYPYLARECKRQKARRQAERQEREWSKR